MTITQFIEVQCDETEEVQISCSLVNSHSVQFEADVP